MSTELIKSELLSFLGRKDAEVLCISGKWGVGKTHVWRKQLEEAQRSENIALERYSYVSLFGIGSLDDLKYAIFENVVPTATGDFNADINTLNGFIENSSGSWRKLARYGQSIPLIKNFTGGDTPAALSFLTIRKQIICIDDIERRGSKLDIADVLGLVSFLKEQRSCKVALILNNEQLDDKSRDNFHEHLDKVVDLLISYEPTPQESTSIALENSGNIAHSISELCVTLGISNIRVIKKIDRLAHKVYPTVSGFNDGVLRKILMSLVLFGWAFYQRETAPSLDFIVSNERRSLFGRSKNDNLPTKEAAWNALLESYGFWRADEFDLVLAEGVRNGYFDLTKILEHGRALHEKMEALSAGGSFEEAWRRYHESFDNDHEEVLDEIYSSFKKNAKYISPINVNSTVEIFRDLHRNEQASEIVACYFEALNDEKASLNLNSYPFHNEITDAELKNEFKKRFFGANKEANIPEIMLKLKSGWNDSDLALLAEMAVDEYYKIFKQHRGKELRTIISGCLQFDIMEPTSKNIKEISARAKDALRRIAGESRINAHRVKKFGISIEEK
ncbi:P-loop NTPase fold protein [Azospirillum canadense]|uniref:P-loop NTPase fold protein n=1 Tax=Azospirillum canadense TaxID=403962 RepID=UPI002226BA55|nr:P-loop NTPase fold protein [Azospirillum canadense]MCW2237625.1 hypothetical protein [Azospirillum canadense]